QYPEKIPGSFEVLDGICWGGDFETAIGLIRSGEIDKAKIRFFIGYSGWGNGQLTGELKEKSWLLAQANRKLVFHSPTDEIWKASLKLLGTEFEMMANFPIDPTLN
ncbi:MAG: YqgE/AlgH family protein, partial [Chitinophagaceae bacterium]